LHTNTPWRRRLVVLCFAIFAIQALPLAALEEPAASLSISADSVPFSASLSGEYRKSDFDLAETLQTRGASNVQPGKSPPPAAGSFWQRLKHAYAEDWHATAPDGPAPARAGYPAPVSSPPFPFADWPYGGSPVIGAPDTGTYPLQEAIDGNRSRTKIYGWFDGGFNVSTSNRGKYANAPTAYDVIPNSIQFDQAALYFERLPDEVQRDHFDWGFRFANLYGLDYRYTTAKGYFSQQLIKNNNTYGYDPVMFYIDLWFPHIAQGLNLRIGRYISVPDIEAQLAPNNYTYSHSLTYTYDCYTQTGAIATVKLNDHWKIQGGISPGCEAAPWVSDAKLTGTACANYTWNTGGDNLYLCANAINDGKYAYNNLQGYYLTWYHKFGQSGWHSATEGWYQYERQVPNVAGNVTNPVPTEMGANGAFCNPGQLRCFAPDWAIVNYLERDFNHHHDSFTIRNEYLDDIRGQRTGFKTRYTEHLIGFNHWIGSTVTIRPELRFEHSYGGPSFDLGTKTTQFTLASDLIYHF
jgi:Putative beta-barrel porin-2, OmpL-like. bbp2